MGSGGGNYEDSAAKGESECEEIDEAEQWIKSTLPLFSSC